MNIKGIHKTSLIDYPGKICSIFFTGGCNMKCRYCHNPGLACNSSAMPSLSNDEAIDFVRERRGFIDGISITGGEPTLSKNLDGFTHAIRDLGLSVKIDTNGLNPRAIEKLLEGKLLDYVALDIKTSPGKYGDLTGRSDAFPKIKETLEAVKASGVDYEIRTTCIPGYVTLKDLEEIRDEIVFVKRYYLQQFVNEKTLDREFTNYEPYPVSFLEELRSFVLSFAEFCAIRGV